MIGLVCIDVDGTLVGRGGEVNPAVWTVAVRLRERGTRLALCTGRPAFGRVAEYAWKLDSYGWHIYQNGASIVRPSSGKAVSSTIPAPLVTPLIERSRASNRVLELYGDHVYRVESPDPRAEQHAASLGIGVTRGNLEAFEWPVVRLEYVLSSLELREVLEEAHPGLTLAVSSSPIMPQAHFVSLTLEGVSKGSAVRQVAADYRVPLAQVMMVGDSPNDLEAMRRVGFPVAMGNATPEVLEAGRFRVGHVDAGGLVEALELALAWSEAE